jgi:hypothetical protein
VRDRDRWARRLDPVIRKICNLLLQLLPVVFSIEKLMCVSIARIWSCTVLPAQCLLSTLYTVEDVLSLLGQDPLTGEGVAPTRRAVASVRTVAAHASALLQQSIITPYPRTRRGESTVRRLPVHSAQCRAALETGGLTVVSAHLPSVSVGRPCSDLRTRSPPTRL